MDILIRNCNLISMARNRPKYEENIDIYIEDDKIAEIGEYITPRPGAYIIDAEGKICMPGLINTHAHLSMSIFRETLDGYTLQNWLTKKIWPMEDKLTPDDVYAASILSCLEMVTTGTTTANDQYFMEESTIEAALKVGTRLQLTRTVNDIGNMQEERMEELEELIQRYNNRYDLITLNVGIHGLYTTGRETVQKLVNYAKENNLPIHMHFCENQKEVEDIKKDYSVSSPVDVIEDIFQDTHTILAHAVKLTDDEIKRLGNMQVHISHCPISNLRLGCGVAKVQEMINNGINVSIGTDGQGSGSNLDMFEAMKFTALLQKGVFENVKNMDSYEVLKMATINGAKALGLEDEIGSVEVRKESRYYIVRPKHRDYKPDAEQFLPILYIILKEAMYLILS